MKLLDYLEPMKTLPNRFSNLAFWRVLRVFKDEVVEAFTYVNSWGSGIEVEQRTQNVSLTEHGQKITDLVAEQATQNNRISALEESDTSVDRRVSDLEDSQKTLNDALEVVEKEQTTQNTNIQQLQTDVSVVNGEIETVSADVSAIKSEQETQNTSIATNRDNINSVNTNLNTLIPFVYNANNSQFKVTTFTDSKGVITQLTDDLYTAATTNAGMALTTPPFYVTSRAAIYIYTNAEKTSSTLINVPMAVIITMLSGGKTDIMWQPTSFYAPYGVKSLMGLYTTYITHI